MCWQAWTPLWKPGLFGFRSVVEPPRRWKPGWLPVPVPRSGKSVTPCERMHLAKLEYSPSEPEDADALLWVVIRPCCATWLLREPAHAAASRARPTAAMIAAGVRAAGRHAPR